MTRLVILAAAVLGLASPCFPKENAEVKERDGYVKRECLNLSDLKDFTPAAEVKLSQYGGWMEKKEKATGFFHAAKLDGQWWVIDPEGYVFLCVGVNSVVPASEDAAANPSPADLEWGEQTLAKLREHGFNMLGCWSATDLVRKLSKPMPYCLRWNIMAVYRKQRAAKYPETGKVEAIYPFDPEFEAFCDQVAKGMDETKDDPWLLGHFSDNELPFHEGGIVERYLSHPQNDPCHEAAEKFMASRKNRKPEKDDDREFLHLVVSEYYRKVSDALRKHDPNHMYIGSRFHGLALNSPALFSGAGRYADIISVNYYHRWTPEHDLIQDWAKRAGKPILITEWYAKAADSGLPIEKGGAGFPVKSQSDRAKFYQHFTLGLLKNPGCVGWHWFKYRDSAENNPGMVNGKDEPYTVLWNAAKEINTQVYPLAKFLRKD